MKDVDMNLPLYPPKPYTCLHIQNCLLPNFWSKTQHNHNYGSTAQSF